MLKFFYQLISFLLKKNLPVGPFFSRVAAQTIPGIASFIAILALLPPISVLTQPGCTELTLIQKEESSELDIFVMAFKAHFEIL